MARTAKSKATRRQPGRNRRIKPLGDSALLVELGSRIDTALNFRAQALAAAMKQRRDVRDAVAGYASVTVHYDPAQITYRGISQVVAKLLQQRAAASWSGRLHRIPVAYDGPDLQQVVEQLELSTDEFARRHCAPIYRVFMIGFVPGFAYLGPLDPSLHIPRLANPRTRVPAGAVGIAGDQTGIYPLASPGGWRLVGSTSMRTFLPDSDPPVLLRPGDRVKLYPA